MDIDEILEAILKKNDIYNEAEIQTRMKKWPGRDARRNALYNIVLKKTTCDENLIDFITVYVAFHNHLSGEVSDLIKETSSLDSDTIKRLQDLSRFYYVECKDPKLFSNLDVSYKLIIMSSLIESLMADEKFKEFNAWYSKDCPEDIKKEALSKTLDEAIKYLWDEYKKKHGAYRKFKSFFDEYLSNDEREQLLGGFKRLDGKQVSINDIARWLYQMRSDFVHASKLVLLPEANNVHLGHIVSGVPLSITMDIDNLLLIFEKGFLRYFKLYK